MGVRKDQRRLSSFEYVDNARKLMLLIRDRTSSCVISQLNGEFREIH